MNRRSFIVGSLITALLWSPLGSAYTHARFPRGTVSYDNYLDFASFGGSPGASGATNIAAVAAFNTAYAALPGRTRLYIAPGTYTGSTCFNFANTVGIAGSQLVIDAYGVIFSAPNDSTQNGFAINAGINTDGVHEARINTVSAGTSTVGLVTGGQTSRFSVGQWCCVSGIDMQGYGDPPNFGIFEYVQIQSIGSGTITFSTPLVNSYKSTWPFYSTGRGGPATVYPMQGFWDQGVEVRGARYTDNGQAVYGKTRVAKWTDVTCDTFGPIPSVNFLYRAVRVTANGTGGFEVDKVIQRMELVDCSIRAMDFQSSSVNELDVDVHSCPNVGAGPRWRGGASKSNVIRNLTLATGGTFSFGEMNYGAMGPTTMTNCAAPAADWFVQTMPFSDMTEEGAGVLSYAGGPSSASAANTYFFVPGQNCVLLDGSNAWARSFQVLDVSQSGGRTYVTTNLPFPVPSTINGKSSPWKIASHPCADLTMIGCTGNSLFTAQSLLPAHTPFQSWTL